MPEPIKGPVCDHATEPQQIPDAPASDDALAAFAAERRRVCAGRALQVEALALQRVDNFLAPMHKPDVVARCRESSAEYTIA